MSQCLAKVMSLTFAECLAEIFKFIILDILDENEVQTLFWSCNAWLYSYLCLCIINEKLKEFCLSVLLIFKTLSQFYMCI